MMGKLKGKRRREAIHFELFQKKHGLFEKPLHDDNPDFRVTCGTEILGIEFTEIYKEEKRNGLKPRQHEAIRERIVNTACQKAIDSKLPPLRVTVHFSGSVKKNRERILSEELFTIVKDHCPAQGSSVTLDFRNSIPDEVRALSVRNISPCKKPLWQYIEASPMYNSFSEQLQETITSKDKKLSEYLKRCNRCWLVVAALGLSGSSFYEFSAEMEKHCYKSSFEKVFFLEAASGNLSELRLDNDS